MLQDFLTMASLVSLISTHRSVVVVLWRRVWGLGGRLCALCSHRSCGRISVLGTVVTRIAILDNGLGALYNLKSLLGGISVEQIIDQSLLHILLIGKILDGSLQLVKRVTHVEQIVQVKGEVDFALFANELSIQFVVYVCVTFFAGLH